MVGAMKLGTAETLALSDSAEHVVLSSSSMRWVSGGRSVNAIPTKGDDLDQGFISTVKVSVGL